MYSQEQVSLNGQLDKTYGYIKSQELLALKIQQNYPELAPRIERAMALFYSNFGPGLKSMDQKIQAKYHNEYPQLSKKLVDLGNAAFKQVSKVEAEKFLHRYEQMSVGRIKSPHLETILEHQFSSLPLLNYYKKWNQQYSVSNFSNSEFIQLELKIPNNWSEQLQKDHALVLKKFRNDLGEGNIILNVVKAQNSNINANSNDLSSLLTELIPSNVAIYQSSETSMGKQHAYYVNYIEQRAEVNSKFKRNVSLYIIEEAGQYFILDFSIYTLNNNTNKITADIKGLFEQIVSTVQISIRPNKKSLVSNKH